MQGKGRKYLEFIIYDVRFHQTFLLCDISVLNIEFSYEVRSEVRY